MSCADFFEIKKLDINHSKNISSVMIIDFSSHIFPPIVAKRLRYRVNSPSGLALISSGQIAPQKRLRIMKKYGVDIQVLSLPAPYLLGHSAADAAKLCIEANDGISKLCEKYPEHFVGMAVISLYDVGSALDELKRSVKDFGFRSVTILTNQRGKGLDSPEYKPFYEKVSAFDVPVLLHPCSWDSYSLVDHEMMRVFGWPFDTTQAMWRIAFNGVLDNFPKIKFVAHHMGGMFPFFNHRMNTEYQLSMKSRIKTRQFEYLKYFYGDTALDGSPESFLCGYAFFGSDKMVYGTDYPFGEQNGEIFLKDNLASVQYAPIDQDSKMKILGGNAKKLLKLR
ncbi:MAG TPA: amidohydrolase family protein [Nitrososphaerales archaeon]|nr:amidohydrolase family protein [Nitrososphaerales archaeon]